MSMQQILFDKINAAISCSVLDVVNESHMHSRGEDSHFKVIAVSESFSGQRLLQRHRTINAILAEELANHIHALAIHAYTPEEFAERQNEAPASPSCLGGSKFD
ncbi:BolA/IbaG family iron-sulfur metabolism protein [Pseudoalteromonas xiamenensis]|uniref:BolA family protein n=1 Tax=Pseudoalteromonas xiamenensis TaxID=882626 RepID=UPI0027E3B305|nr:BolA/IbaG family iron-sulfur metabolism protein [Pseudoalteromonas xiamenensis]WMN59174.1 BolA/IbaG family iron-sulfur metabolism protein [Pseudoalteromonas xiamenensis]